MEKEKFRYNKEFLQLIIERDNCIIDLDKIIKPNKNSKIDFICNCGTSHNKGMLSLRINGGAFCIKCTNKNKIEKTIKTCLEKYGKEYSLQCENIRNKGRKTCLEKYGIESPIKLETFKNKSKQTCLAKYGKEYSLQCENIRNKGKETCLIKYGNECHLKSKEIIEKKEKTCLERYGNKNPMKNEEIKKKL